MGSVCPTMCGVATCMSAPAQTFAGTGSPNRALQLQAHERIDLLCKLVRKLVEDIRTEARYDGCNGLLRIDAPLLEVEQLVLANLAG